MSWVSVSLCLKGQVLVHEDEGTGPSTHPDKVIQGHIPEHLNLHP